MSKWEIQIETSSGFAFVIKMHSSCVKSYHKRAVKVTIMDNEQKYLHN